MLHNLFDLTDRVTLVSGAVVGVPTSSEIDSAVNEMWKVKGAVLSPPWYGLELTMNIVCECGVKYNYDPKCDEDESFYGD